MYQIFKNEMRRYRSWALGFALVHVSYWVFVNTFSMNKTVLPKLIPVHEQFTMTIFVAMFIGFLFGMVQIGRYKPINTWTYLMQRPLPVFHIYVAIAGAALMLLIGVFMLPWLLIVAVFDIFTETVVDVRHYLHGFYILGVALTAYLGGSFAKLSPRKAAFLVTVLAVFVVGHPPNILDHTVVSFGTFALICMVVIAWLLYLNVRAFKPDLRLPETGIPALLLMALPVQMAVLFGLGFLFFASSEISQHMASNSELELSEEQLETYFFQLNPKVRVNYLLEKETIPNAVHLKHQLKLADVGYSRAVPVNYPKRHQMYIYDQPGFLSDRETGTYWVFSHSEMLFKGTNGLNGQAVGWLGEHGFKEKAADFDDGMRFRTVPKQISGRFLQLEDVIYQIDFKNRFLHEKHRLGEGEFYYGGLSRSETYLSIASNLHLYLFDIESFWDEPEATVPEMTIPHPLDVKHISHMRTFRLVDGYLILYANDYLFGGGRPGAILMRARLNGQHEILASREFEHFDKPTFIRYGRFAISPLLNAMVEEGIWGWIEPEERRHQRMSLFSTKIPPSLLWLWIGLSVICSGICFLWCGRYQLSSANRWMWIILNAAFGLPGLISFWLLNSRPS